MLHFTFQNMRALYGPWPRGLGLKSQYEWFAHLALYKRAKVRFAHFFERFARKTDERISNHGKNHLLLPTNTPSIVTRDSLEKKPKDIFLHFEGWVGSSFVTYSTLDHCMYNCTYMCRFKSVTNKKFSM